MILNDTFVQVIKTSFGVYHRFYKHRPEDEKVMYELGLLPYHKVSSYEFQVFPDLCCIKKKCDWIKSLENYDSDKQYINIFKGDKKMNYSHGFPVFDDEYEDNITNKNDVNINKDKEINIKQQTEKEEPKKDKNALF